jgi:DNA-binding response OmpR family regulator
MSEKVLIADRNLQFMVKAESALQQAGYLTVSAASYGEAKGLLAAEAPELVLCADALSTGSGLELVRHLRKAHGSGVACAVLFGKDDADAWKAAAEAGAEGYLVHPLKPGDLVACARTLSQIRKLKLQLEAARATRLQPGEGIFEPRTGFYTFEHFK